MAHICCVTHLYRHLFIFHQSFSFSCSETKLCCVTHHDLLPLVCTHIPLIFSFLIFIVMFSDIPLFHDSSCFYNCSLYNHLFNFSSFIFIFMFRDIRLLRDSPAVSRYWCLEVQKAVDNVAIRWKVDLNEFQLVVQINPKQQKETKYLCFHHASRYFFTALKYKTIFQFSICYQAVTGIS